MPRLDIAMPSPSLLNHVKEITQKAHHFEATDHSTIEITFDINRINKLQIHLGMILSNEPTLESLIQRPLAVSNATLHEFIFMKLMEVT